MPIIIFRGKKTIFKTKVIKYLIDDLRFLYFDTQGETDILEAEELLNLVDEISTLLASGKYLLLSSSFYGDKSLYAFIDKLKVDTRNIYYLMRTDEDNLLTEPTFYKHELLINHHQDMKQLSKGVLKIAKTLHKVEPQIIKIINSPNEPLNIQRPDISNSTSIILHSFPVFGLLQMIINVLKYYIIDNNKSKSLDLLIELVKLTSQLGFTIRKGAKFYRVCNYKEDANYQNLSDLWYPSKYTSKDVRIENDKEKVLFVGERWENAFFEVYDEKVDDRLFAILEIEVIKPFEINYIAPLDLTSSPGASINNLYIDYVKESQKEESKGLLARQELIRNFVGDFMISNKNFDKDFTYDFTKHLSSFLLSRFDSIALAYLSTQSNYQNNNIAIPAHIADDCLLPGKVAICKHEFRPLGKGKNPFVRFDFLRTGYIDLASKKIVYEI